MVAKAAWLSVEPRVCLAEYLASEDPKYWSDSQSWECNQEDADVEGPELRCSGDDSLEIE
jgi:hypothetical protein